MAYRYVGKNTRPFSAITHNNYGRTIIYTNQNRIDESNIVQELDKALVYHTQNATEIEYLDRYYRGDQPILYRKKVNRPEVNNKVLVNLAYELVERKVAGICAEPIQYVLRGTDDVKSEEITQLNAIMDSEDKQECDIEICRWRSICGTSYRFVGNDNNKGRLLDESDFSLSCENPIYTFVAYFTNGKPAFSCQIREGEDGKRVYYCFTDYQYFIISGGVITESGINGNGAIPVIEYPNNSRRLSDIEITISITDSLNVLSSDRINGIEQFICSFMKFINCDIDSNEFAKLKDLGAISVKSNNGDNRADVDIISQELNQTEGQVVFDDLFNKFLEVQGLARQGGFNSGGDTQGAVELREGHYESGLRDAINEPVFKKSERMTLRIILNRLMIKRNFVLKPSDIEIHLNRNKLNNLLTKSEALQILLNCGIHYKRAIKTVDLFSDSERVADESKERMNLLYPTDIEIESQNRNKITIDEKTTE